MELKHLIFILSVMGIIPLTLLLMLSQRSMKVCVFLIPVCFWKYQSTAINFLSNPDYKGTALGFEISIIHLIAIALLAAMLLRGWPVKIFFPGFGLYVLFFFICALSIHASEEVLYSSFELLKLFLLLLVSLSLANYFYNTHDFDSFMNGLSVVIFISFVISLRMKYFDGYVQVPGIFPHQNSQGMFMCLLGPVFLARMLNNKENLIKFAISLGTFLMTFLCVLFTFSRGSMACFPLGCVVTVFLSVSLHNSLKTMMVLLITGILSTAAGLYAGPRIINRFDHAPQASADMRKMLADIAVNIMKDKPFLGCGLNTWSIIGSYPKYNPHMKRTIVRGSIGIVETTYLLVGAECGLMGLSALICWFLYYLFQAMFQAFRWRKTDFFYLFAGLAGGLTSNYLQSTLEWVLKQPINFCTLMCCFGILASLIQNAKEKTFLSKLEFIALRKELRRRKYEEAIQHEQNILEADAQSQMVESTFIQHPDYTDSGN